MYRDNTKNVMSNAVGIARLLRDRRATLTDLMKEYRCGYSTIMQAILSQMSKAEYKQIRHNIVANSGRATRFAPGHAARNKGLKGLHVSPATEFKKGCLRGQAARNWRPIGAVAIRYDSLFRWQRSRIHKDGTSRKGKPRRWIKIRDYGPPQNRWIPYARFLWEKQHGPVPTGYIVVHKDANQMNDVIDNLIIVTRSRNLTRTCHSNPEVVARRSQHAAKTRRRGTPGRRNLRRKATEGAPAWYCPVCGATYESGAPPQRCRKCSAMSFEKIRLPRTKIG